MGSRGIASGEKERELQGSVEELAKNLLKLFWEKPERSPKELRELLNIDSKALRKVISYLRRRGFNVTYDKKGKFYKIDLTSKSRIASLLALSLIYRRTNDPELKSELINYITQEFNLEPFTVIEIEDFSGFREHLLMSVEGINLNLFWKIQEAIKESKELRIIYKESSETPPQWFIVRPIYLALLKGFWYLISYEPSEETVKLYKLDNIESAFYTGRSFKVSEGFFLEDHLPILAYYLRPKKKYQVKVVFDKGMEWVADRIWHPTQEVSFTPDGRLVLTMTIANTEEFFCWLASFGYRARLVHPKGLIEAYKSFISLILNLYSEQASLTDEELSSKLKHLSDDEKRALRDAVMETLREPEE